MQSAPKEPEPRSDKLPPPRLGAVILAAGRSARFEEGNKLLAPFRGQPLIWSALSAVSGAHVSEIIVVTTEDIARACASTSWLSTYRFVIQDPNFGMAASLKAGLAALSPSSNGAMILLADMPLVGLALIASLISAYQDHGGTKIIFPANSIGENGHPVLWPRSFFPELMRLEGDRGAKHLLEKNKSSSVSIRVNTDEAFVDVDTRDDYERLIKR